jgi:hypothetical protein
MYKGLVYYLVLKCFARNDGKFVKGHVWFVLIPHNQGELVGSIGQ